MKIAVVVGAYNEERHISELLDALLVQAKTPDQIIIVDDGSKDKTGEIIKAYVTKNPLIKYIRQENAGPAAARNKAWKNSEADICIFTDGDCVPNADWIEKLIEPFNNSATGAVAGTYRTINKNSALARFIGLEIEWKHRHYGKTINVHGTYNLAVRKNVLEEIGGLDESFPFPSGEDWDMTYKISRKYNIIFVPEAIVGHYHPEKFWPYMKNQVRRGFDRVKVYKDNPEIAAGDDYTPFYVKYQVLASGMFLLSLLLFYPWFKFSFFIPLGLLIFLFATVLPSFFFIFKKDRLSALYGIPIQFARNFAWFFGLFKGIIEFGI